MNECPIRSELAMEAEGVLSKIIAVNEQQIEALHTNDWPKLMQFDRELENLVGLKERIFGALQQHRRDHGC